MATIEIPDESLGGYIEALNKGALSIALIDRADRYAVTFLEHIQHKLEEAKRAL